MVANSVGQWKQRIAKAVSGLAGNADADFGSELEQSQITAHNNYVSNYGIVAQNPGMFKPTFASTLPSAIAESLENSNLPPTFAKLMQFPQYSTTATAMKWLLNQTRNLSGELTPGNLMELRKGLGTFWSQARGPDEAGIGALIGGLDNHIQTQAAAGNFIGDGATVASQMNGAISSFRGYKQAFANTSNPTHSIVAKAVKNFTPDQSRDISGIVTAPSQLGSAAAAQGPLGAGVINPKTLQVPPGGQKLYGKLQDVMGGPDSPGSQALNNYIRQTVTKLTVDGRGNQVLSASPNQIQEFLKSPLASVFNPQEQSLLRQAAEAQRLLSAAPVKGTVTNSAVNQVVGRVLRTGVGAAAGHVVGGPLGGVLGMGTEMAMEPMLATREAANALKGAPKVGLLNTPGRIVKGITDKPPSALLGTFYNTQPDTTKTEAPSSPVAATDKDVDALTRMAIKEAGNQPTEGKAAAIYTAINRSRASGKSIYDEVHVPYAYTSVTQGLTDSVDPDSSEYKQIRDNIVIPALSGDLPDPTEGMTHFINKEQYAKERPGHPLPGWAQGDGKQIGAHTFFRADGGRVGRASGGAVDIEPLISRLFSSVEAAKKAEAARTKPLLHVPDATIAKALQIAQGAAG